MSGEMMAAWQLLTAVARARQQLSSTRPVIWQRARLPTADHAVILPPAETPAGAADQVVVRVSLETHLPDGRRVISCLDVTAKPDTWRVRPYIELSDRQNQLIWDGQFVESANPKELAGLLDRATQALISATLGLDFATFEQV